MTSDDLEHIRDTVRDEIKISVNGKVDAIRAEMISLRETIEPLIAFLKVTQGINRFVKWTGIPIVVFFAWIFGLFK